MLVSEPFQAHPQFSFPPRMLRVLLDRNQRPSGTEAQLILAKIPIVRLCDGPPHGYLTADCGYSDLVAAAQQAIAPPELVVD